MMTPRPEAAGASDHRRWDEEVDRRNPISVRGPEEIVGALSDFVSEFRLSEVLAQVVRTALRLVDASDAFLAVLDREDRILELVRACGPSPAEPLPLPGSSELPAERAPSLERAIGEGATLPNRHFVKVPVRSRRGFRGDLYTVQDQGVYSDADEALLTSFAAVAGAVIDKAQLYEEGRRRELWVALQGEIATALLAGANMVEVLDSVARGARELTDSDFSTVLLYDGSSSLTLSAADGLASRDLVGETFLADTTISGTVIETGEPMIITDGTSEERTREPLFTFGVIGGALIVPLPAKGRATGTLAVGRMPGSPPLTQTDFWLLESFASQVNIALEYGRTRCELERLAVVEDQERIARDLHDTVIQQLFATGMSLQATAQRTPDCRTAERIQLAVDSLDTVIRDIRSAVFALHSTVCAPGGIRAALRDIAAQMLESSNLTVKMDFDGPVDTAISTAVQEHIIATVREALSNANRHANASRIDVILHVGSDVVLRVIDDGVGVAPDNKPRGGLLNLKARAQRLGGTMVLRCPPTGGTELEWRVPDTTG